MRLWHKFLTATFLVAFSVMIIIDWTATLIFILVSSTLTLIVLIFKGFRLMRAIYLFLGVFLLLTVYILILFALKTGSLSLILTLRS